MTLSRLIPVLMIATIFVTGAAHAEGKKLAEKLSDTAIIIDVEISGCDSDRAILCPGLPANSKNSLMCLMAYEANLSASCAIGIVEAAVATELGMLAIEHSINACEADADKFCLDVEPGEGRLISCLKKNEKKLDARCASALKDTGLWDLGGK
jgi:hypothetical protein